jgi:tetratricopeptide (TPR) repeat protein
LIITFLWFLIPASALSQESDVDDLARSPEKLAQLHFKLGDVYLDAHRARNVSYADSYAEAVRNYKKGLQLAPKNTYYHNRLAYAYHLERRLKEASFHYARVLELDPPENVSAEEFDWVLKLAPRVYTNPQEYFSLEDVVVVMHPDKPLIEYSFFWDDDIDFPEDNDPTDHEKVWVEYDPETKEFVALYTYFHRAILSTAEAKQEASQNGGRPRVNVQWGGHGSLPVGWEAIPSEKIAAQYQHVAKPDRIDDMRTRYARHAQTIRMPDHPLARLWPKKFSGTWEEYITFSRYVDLPEIIRQKKMVIKSRWPNAVIDQYFLDYQFYPKMDWPDEAP